MEFVIYDKKTLQLGLLLNTALFNEDIYHLTEWITGEDIMVQHYVEAHCELLGIL